MLSAITVEVNGSAVYLSEWSEMRSAKDTLVKLILAVRFYRKLRPIWDRLDNEQKYADELLVKYLDVRAILFCVKGCCQNNLVKFYKQWGTRFHHHQFSKTC